MEIKIDKEQLVQAGKVAGQIGKQVLVKGLTAVALGAVSVGMESMLGGRGIKDLGVNDYLGNKKKVAEADLTKEDEETVVVETTDKA